MFEWIRKLIGVCRRGDETPRSDPATERANSKARVKLPDGLPREAAHKQDAAVAYLAPQDASLRRAPVEAASFDAGGRQLPDNDAAVKDYIRRKAEEVERARSAALQQARQRLAAVIGLAADRLAPTTGGPGEVDARRDEDLRASIRNERSQDDERYVVIDCETTGLSAEAGDRIVSFAAIEIINNRPSGRGVNLIFNPGRKSHPRALQVHGLSDAVLRHQEPFAEFAEAIWDFLNGAVIVGHNVQFDIGFLNNEFRLCRLPELTNKTVCTMQRYREIAPGRSSLDVAARCYSVDVSARERFHGAFVDAEITSQLFQAMVLRNSTIYTARHIEPTNYKEPPAKSLTPARSALQQARKDSSPPYDISGCSFSITGDLNAMSRDEAVKVIEESGGTWHRNVRKDTDFLVVGNDPGATKMNTAASRREKYGKPEFIVEAQFLSMLQKR